MSPAVATLACLGYLAFWAVLYAVALTDWCQKTPTCDCHKCHQAKAPCHYLNCPHCYDQPPAAR